MNLFLHSYGDFAVFPFCIVIIKLMNAQFKLSTDCYTVCNQSEMNKADTDIFVDKDTIYKHSKISTIVRSTATNSATAKFYFL